MGFDEALAARIRTALGELGMAEDLALSEKQMFGGLAFLLEGAMFAGVIKDELMVRVGKERHDEAVARPHARMMDFTHRPMRGYVQVAPAGCADVAALVPWLELALAHAATLLGVKKGGRADPAPAQPPAKRKATSRRSPPARGRAGGGARSGRPQAPKSPKRRPKR